MKRLLFLLFILSTSIVCADDKSCAECHAEQYTDWQSSDHAWAMRNAKADTVLGRFDGEARQFLNHTVRFYQKQKQYWISILEGEKQHGWQILYTFGHQPLQQYLVATESGKMQALPYAWDSRAEAQGGQRWINLFDDVASTADRLHWQQPLQNWNGMCADCHSTGLTRGYKVQSNHFSTTWQDINVDCKACHNIDDSHYAEGKQPNKPSEKSRTWHRKPEDPVARLTVNGEGDVGMDTCFACHSLRSPLRDGHASGVAFLDQFKPTWLLPPLYHVDGQIKEEVYVYGSFIQSKMYHSGVECTDCHNPHSGKIKLSGNQLCTQCHSPERFDHKDHHQHDQNAGSQCVSCHMPEQIYMKVDGRRDHSFSVPDLAFSRTFKTPLACDQCHAGQGDSWFKNNYVWRNKAKGLKESYARFMSGDFSSLGKAQWMELLNSPDLAVIKRASVIAYSGINGLQIPVDELIKFTHSEEALLRLAAAEALANYPAPIKQRLLIPLLQDELASIRIAAAQGLTGVEIPKSAKAGFEAAFKELLFATEQQCWRGEGRANLANIYLQQGDLQTATQQLEQAISIDPYYAVGYLNLADLYRQQGTEKKVKDWLEQGLRVIPESGVLHYSLGLHYIRVKQFDLALGAVETAHNLEPQNPQFGMALLTMYEELGKTDKHRALLKKLEETDLAN